MSESERNGYVRSLVSAARGKYATCYFGGGSPALCDLRPLLEIIAADEFTVELHPLDVTADLLKTLKDGGVNRISMGVQSLDDAILADMGRGYTFAEAERAFALVKEYFDNAGIDLIVGYPGETAALTPRHARLAKWGLRHCSVYSLILEEKTLLWKRCAGDREKLPSDEVTLDRIAIVSRFLADLGLERYEISNYAQPGYECRHNLAVWRGEDYIGLGDGAYGREGLKRTVSLRGRGDSAVAMGGQIETVTPDADRRERMLFRLRLREGLDANDCPQWWQTLDRHTSEGLLCKAERVYRLTERGTEVCDSILADLI